MSALARYQPLYTVNDYMQWKGDWELWAGHPVSMSPSPFGRHQAILTKIASLLVNAVENANCAATVIAEIDWVVDPTTVVRPDVLVVCGESPERHVEQAPALTVEVISATSIERDRIYKRELYRDKGVGNYLIVDHEKRTIILHRQSNRWAEETIEQILDLTICEDCRLSIDLSRIFQ
ncbi:Uma2 family endonuclease [Neorhodopirellula pilleata]|uniref:Putative restriction endonuclease domain-containing protein n=1 Tax=Neorhodopirellula pilleata TaxID=2714738 RepID=A0A5C6A8H1_9BACT|nr:Uma2 family endonuclease [Neorhodopirellula pilleata]TWT95595.1 hypothetical protein Pla100_32360 [Neorhodopirellula pilleata]